MIDLFPPKRQQHAGAAGKSDGDVTGREKWKHGRSLKQAPELHGSPLADSPQLLAGGRRVAAGLLAVGCWLLAAAAAACTYASGKALDLRCPQETLSLFLLTASFQEVHSSVLCF